MKKIISSILTLCLMSGSGTVVLADKAEIISTDVYKIDNTAMCIYDIPYETTVEGLKGNIESAVEICVTDINGNEKSGRIEDGDRLLAENDGTCYEYYLKTYIDGVGYSDNFNYRSYEEYKTILDATNKTNRSNVFAKEDVSFGEIVEYNGDNVLKISPKRIKNGNTQYNRFNFIAFPEIKGKAVVEYDIWQYDVYNDNMWAYVNARYSGVADKPETGYALWGSRISERGTLMRSDSNSARWISYEKKPLFMKDGIVFHVRQVIDFNGDIETYINGVQADVTNETLSQTVSKATGNFSGIYTIGMGIYVDQGGDWTDNADGYGVMWDNVKVYDPVKYAEFYIDLLPEKNADVDESIAAKVETVKAVVEGLMEYAITEDEISNYDKYKFWAEQSEEATVESEIYQVNNSDKTIKNVLIGQTVGEVIENIEKVSGYKYEITGKNSDDEVETGDVLKVTNLFDVTAEFSLTVDKDINIRGYDSDNDTISGIPYKTTVEEFLENVLRADSTVAEIYRNDMTNTYILKSGDVLKVTFKNGDTKEYLLTVESGRNTADLSAEGDITVDKEKCIISGVRKGMTVSEFKGNLYISDGGKIEVYSKEGKELTNGKITGTEYVKVFPEDPEADKICDIYTVSCEPEFIGGEEIVVTTEDEGFIGTGEIHKSGSAVESGYNGIVTTYVHNGNGIFTYDVDETNEYGVYIYTSYHSSNKEYTAQITHKDGVSEVTVPQQQESGWKFVGTYDFEKGAEAKVECVNPKSGYARISAVKFEKTGKTVLITDAKAISGESETALSEGKNNILKKDVYFSFVSDGEIKAEDVKIISERGNNTDFTFEKNGNVCLIYPEYPLKDGVTYFVTVESTSLSKAYTYMISGKEKGVYAKTEIAYFDKNDIFVGNATEAEYAQIGVNIRNTTSEEISAKLVICYYSANGKVSGISIEDVNIDAEAELDFNKRMEIETPSETGKIKVYLWNGSFEPLGDVH